MRIEEIRQTEYSGQARPSVGWLCVPMMAALLAFTACGAAAATPGASPPAISTSPGSPTAEQTPLSTSLSQVTQETSLPVSTCVNPAALTPAMTEGPYFTSGSPERQSLLEDNMTGTHLTLTGYVFSPECQPIANALLDFWQADGDGIYDNTGYHLRGHQFTDESGRYQLETVVPGEYPGRTPHIHVKVQTPGGPVLTSQLYFPGAQGNETDSIFSPELVVNIRRSNGEVEATFDFVVSTQ